MTNWPWPMDGVQQWFENLWNYVSETAYGAVTWVWEQVWDKIQWIRDRIDESITWVYNQIKPTIDAIADAVSDIWLALDAAIEGGIGSLSGALTGISDWLGETLSEWFSSVSDWVTGSADWLWSQIQTVLGDVSGGISGSITSLLEGFSQSLSSGINWIHDQINDALGYAIDNITGSVNTLITETNEWVGDVVSGGMDWVTQALQGVAGRISDGFRGFFEWLLSHISWFAEMIWGAVEMLMGQLGDLGTRLISMLTNILTSAFSMTSPPPNIKQASDVMIEALYERQMIEIDSMYQSEPSFAALMNKSKELQGVLLTAGIAASAGAIIGELAHPLKNMGIRATVRELVYWSGIPSVTAAIAITPTAIGLLQPLRYALNERWTPMIPPSTDLVRFSVREVYQPERREALLAFYPGEPYQSYMAKLGYRPEFAEHYWMAHWVLPSVSQLNDMLYRGIIDRERWEEYVRYNDYIPEMIPNLGDIIYSPYTRVDIRRIYDMGLATRDEMYENYRWLGYDHEHAEKMTIWSMVYEEFPVLLAQYQNGWITIEDVKTSLIELGMPEDRAERLLRTRIEPQQPLRLADQRDLTMSAVARLYILGQMEEGEARELLMDMGYDEREADYILTLYSLTYNNRDLTPSQVMNAIGEEILSLDFGTTYMRYLGYDEFETTVLFMLGGIYGKELLA